MNNITEEIFWNVVKATQWNEIRTNENHTKLGREIIMQWMENNNYLRYDVIKQLEKIYYKFYNSLYKKLKDIWLDKLDISDDTFGDLLDDIIGRGKEVYKSVYNEPSNVFKYAGDIVESFAYIFPSTPDIWVKSAKKAQELILSFNNDWTIVRIEKNKYLLFDNHSKRYPVRCKHLQANNIRNRLSNGESLTDIWVSETVDSAYKIITDKAIELETNGYATVADLRDFTDDDREVFEFGRLLVLCGLRTDELRDSLDYLDFVANIVCSIPYANCIFEQVRQVIDGKIVIKMVQSLKVA